MYYKCIDNVLPMYYNCIIDMREVIKMTELYVVAENGQLEINWESLELITNAEFIEAVQYELNDGYELKQLDTQGENTNYFIVTAYLFNGSQMTVVNFSSFTFRNDHKSISVHKHRFCIADYYAYQKYALGGNKK
jgi:hypothetical protein